MSDIYNDNTVKKLREDLSRLLDYVDKTRTGIEYVESTVMVGSEKVPEASVQIRAVTGDLENAANTIMTILEEVLSEQERSHALIASLSEWVNGLPEKDREKGSGAISELSSINEKTKKNMMDILTNMSFHDLSGQKLKKVTNSLSIVQAKLTEIAMSFGIKPLNPASETARTRGNGITADPMDQNIVDQLLKELGT